MKSCLKLSSLPSTPRPDCTHKHKCVAFCSDDGLEQIFLADEWDRTPIEPTPNLSYSDILEFKAIQRSLPTAPQPPDPLSSRPSAPLLATIPIRLLPLCPETRSACGAHAKPPSPTAPPAAPFHVTFKASYTCPSSTPAAPGVGPPQLSQWHRPHTPVTVASPRPRAKLNFLPLLDSNSSSSNMNFSAGGPRNAPSPPSSPHTFAEFEASLALGEDILHHHSPQQHRDPSPQPSPCSDSRDRDGSGGDGHGHRHPHSEQPPVPVPTPALTDASSLPSSPSSSYLSLSSSPSFSLASSPEPYPRGCDDGVRVEGDGRGRDDRGHAHVNDDDDDVALDKSGKGGRIAPLKEPEAVVRIQVEPATPRATSASGSPPFSPISVSAPPAATLSTTTTTSTTATSTTAAPRRFAPSSPPSLRPQGSLALKSASKGASPVLASPSCRPVGVGPSSPKLVPL